MYDSVIDMLEICGDLLNISLRLIIAERDSNREEIRKLEAKLAGYTANKTLAEVLKND